jgi:RNA polymerase sigma-70 factor (ECF subfamily)
MQAEVRSRTARGTVPGTVTVDGNRTDGPARTRAGGDDDAARQEFDALVAQHLPALRARAAQLCRSHYEPEDVVQDALVRAFVTTSRVSDPSRIRAWLLTIVTNTFIDLTRRRRRRPEHVQLVVEPANPPPLEPGPWDQIGSDDLRRAIDRLPDDVRETYRLFALDGHDYAEIATQQQIPVATVGTRLYRARKRLRALLTAELGPEPAR